MVKGGKGAKGGGKDERRAKKASQNRDREHRRESRRALDRSELAQFAVLLKGGEAEALTLTLTLTRWRGGGPNPHPHPNQGTVCFCARWNATGTASSVRWPTRLRTASTTTPSTE